MNTALININLDPLQPLKHGKVRTLLAIDKDQILIVASDRISAYDSVLQSGIPGKGIILTQLSNMWFRKSSHIIKNHIITNDSASFPKNLHAYGRVLSGRSIIVKSLKILPFEFVVRGYITGSLWADYRKGIPYPGVDLKTEYVESQKLSEPVFTPTTKADAGHDEPVGLPVLYEKIGKDLTNFLRDKSIELYLFASEYAGQRGIIIADTKFEFGMKDDEPYLADEIFTPDSSRFWPAENYKPGCPQNSFDKQYVRDYLNVIQWDRTPPAPSLPEEVILNTQKKYLEAYRRLAGSELDLSEYQDAKI